MAAECSDSNATDCSTTPKIPEPRDIVCKSERLTSATSTSVVTINIENFNTNKLFLETLLTQFDIVCIQEHWLYNSEKFKPEAFCHERGFDCFLKYSDDADPLSPLQQPRDKGGTGILWSNNISKNVERLPDGSNKICAIMCNTSNYGLVCIINVYLPCRGYKDSDDRFADCLEELKEIVIKFSMSAHIIVLGDFNASLPRDKNLLRDRRLKSFLEDFSLRTIQNYPNDSTYMHERGKSTIDYISLTEVGTVMGVEVRKDYSENTSPHYPAVAEMAHIPERECRETSAPNRQHKVNWLKVDKNKYCSLVTERIKSSINDQDLDIDLIIQKISDIIVQSSHECAPRRRNNTPKNKKIWCSELKVASKKSKEAFSLWKNAGKPSDPENINL